MIKKIISGYSSYFNSIGKFLVLLLSCAALGGIIVFPLWKFATSAPDLYTLILTLIISAMALFFIVKKIIRAGLRSSLSFFLKLIVIASGFFAFVRLVLLSHRIAAFSALIASVLVYGLISLFLSPSKKAELKSEKEI